MKHSLFAAFLTTVSRKQARQSFCLLLQPWRWNNNTSVATFLHNFSVYLSGDAGLYDRQQLVPFYNARSALYHGLQYLGVKSGDVVAVQGYTCVSVINAIKATGAIPLYVDIEKASLNMDPVKLEVLLEQQTVKVVIIQHTLGIVANIDALRTLCDRYNCQLLEDCAHSLGASYHDKKVGLRGDVSIFSFGRDKIISSVNGGVLLLNTLKNDHKEWKNRLVYNPVPFGVVIRNLFYAIIGYLASVSYDFLKFGKVLYWVSGKSKLFPDIVSQAEKRCDYQDLSLSLPPMLAVLANTEIPFIDQKNARRRRHAASYQHALGTSLVSVERGDQAIEDVYLRCVYLVQEEQRNALEQKLKANKVYPGDWYQQVVAPKGVDFDAIGYRQGSCPVAEKIAAMTLNIPNHAGISDAGCQKVIGILQQ